MVVHDHQEADTSIQSLRVGSCALHSVLAGRGQRVILDRGGAQAIEGRVGATIAWCELKRAIDRC